MNEGFVFLHRKLKDWEWYLNVPVKTLFIHCLIMANFKDKRWQGEEVKRGSFITSINKLHIETGLSERQVRTALDKLKLTNEVTIKSNNKYSVVTVLNYNNYQYSDKQDVKPKAIKKQSSDTLSDNQTTTTNNNNKLKNDNNVNKEKKKYFASASLNELFEDFLKMRKKLKAVNSERAIKIQVNKLSEFNDQEKTQMLENAIANSWKSTYPLSDNNSSGKGKKEYEPPWLKDVMKEF